MKNLRNLMAWITISAVLMMGTASANAMVLVGDRSEVPCTTQDETTVLDYMGVIVGGLTGVIVGGRTGVIVGGRAGVIVGGRDGVIVGGKSSTGCETQNRDGILLSD